MDVASIEVGDVGDVWVGDVWVDEVCATVVAVLVGVDDVEVALCGGELDRTVVDLPADNRQPITPPPRRINTRIKKAHRLALAAEDFFRLC